MVRIKNTGSPLDGQTGFIVGQSTEMGPFSLYIVRFYPEVIAKFPEELYFYFKDGYDSVTFPNSCLERIEVL